MPELPTSGVPFDGAAHQARLHRRRHRGRIDTGCVQSIQHPR